MPLDPQAKVLLEMMKGAPSFSELSPTGARIRNAWKRDAGLRIDHLLLSPSVAGRLQGAGVDREIRGWEKASDHASTWGGDREQ